MECFQSSEAISASECGHVFHEACIARWLGESGDHCPYCRTAIIDKERLVRLFFFTTTAKINHQHAGDNCERQEVSTATLGCAECRQKEATIEELAHECRRQASLIGKLTDACRKKDETIGELAYSSNQLTKALELAFTY